MKEIKIRDKETAEWIKVNVLPNDERIGWVQIQGADGLQWVELVDVHPALDDRMSDS